MNRSTPYQPLILRILHGISGTLVIGAIISGFLVYNTFAICPIDSTIISWLRILEAVKTARVGFPPRSKETRLPAFPQSFWWLFLPRRETFSVVTLNW
jgi:hypothetical protein